jgi:hypothetical protein
VREAIITAVHAHPEMKGWFDEVLSTISAADVNRAAVPDWPLGDSVPQDEWATLAESERDRVRKAARQALDGRPEDGHLPLADLDLSDPVGEGPDYIAKMAESEARLSILVGLAQHVTNKRVWERLLMLAAHGQQQAATSGTALSQAATHGPAPQLGAPS